MHRTLRVLLALRPITVVLMLVLVPQQHLCTICLPCPWSATSVESACSSHGWQRLCNTCAAALHMQQPRYWTMVQLQLAAVNNPPEAAAVLGCSKLRHST